jgi:uncharacterized phage protein (TIGR01671 family)
MSREIKFRAWLNADKLMVPVIQLNDSGNIGVSIQDSGPFMKRPAEYELMQFTGLCDKNEKEIYEGDILRLSPEWAHMIGAQITDCVVGFDKGCFMFGRREHGYPDSYLWISQGGEVVGNIHQNPELLK